MGGHRQEGQEGQEALNLTDRRNDKMDERPTDRPTDVETGRLEDGQIRKTRQDRPHRTGGVPKWHYYPGEREARPISWMAVALAARASAAALAENLEKPKWCLQ